jgi:chitinase
MDIIPIGFVNVFPDQQNGPGNDYGNACGSTPWTAPDGTQTQMLTECSQIAEDIKTCQAAGKKIFASIGGATPGGNFLASSDSALAFADFLWGTFGPLQDPTLTQFPRPFGTDTIVDGFDLDIESGPDSFYSDLVNELRAKFATSTGTYYISAAPQCVVPDAHLDDAIMHSSIDYLYDSLPRKQTNTDR